MVVELGKSQGQVARDLGLHSSTLGRWVRAWRRDHGEGGPSPASPADAARMAAQEAELKRLRLENGFLKKAAAFFARELPQG
jgi:transposase-like protein